MQKKKNEKKKDKFGTARGIKHIIMSCFSMGFLSFDTWLKLRKAK